nr:reverse transcriptase domain-containing protein [Tanacetum cinerariifolium]
VRTSRNKPQDSSASGSSSQNDAIIALAKLVEALVSSMNKPVHALQEAGPSVPPPPLSSSSKEVERDLETKTRSSEIPPSPVSISSELTQQNPHQPPIPYPSRMSKEKDLLYNKEKLLELENTPLTEDCSAVLPKKLPKKLRNPGKFLIPCDFSEPKEWRYLLRMVVLRKQVDYETPFGKQVEL